MAAFLEQLQQVKLKKTAAPKERTLCDRLAEDSAAKAASETTRLSYAEARAMAGVVAGGAHEQQLHTAKVMVLQRNCVSPIDLDNILSRERDITGRAADFVILPEGAHHEGGTATLEQNSLLRDLAEIVSKHKVYAVLGTMGEKSCGKFHCTALVVGPSGNLLATYRKRATQGVNLTPGTEACSFDTPFGKVGVMICYDAENEDVVEEALHQTRVSC